MVKKLLTIWDDIDEVFSLGMVRLSLSLDCAGEDGGGSGRD
jgi:hypothetical protein